METRVRFRFPSLSTGGKIISASSNQLPVTFPWIRTGLLNAAWCGGVVFLTCQHFEDSVDRYCRTILGCHARQNSLPKGDP